MKRFLQTLASVIAFNSSSGLAAAPAAPTTWSFDTDALDAAPVGFRVEQTGGGAVGRWLVRKEPDAPSPSQVLAQVDTGGSGDRFPLAVADSPSLADLRLSVKCKAVGGRVDQACGLVFRYRDSNNYYVTRANALEGNIRLYFVKNGQRKQLASWSGQVTAGVWHELRAEAKGTQLAVYWDGTKVLEARDETFPAAGRVGVWTKADSVTLFDDLSVVPL